MSRFNRWSTFMKHILILRVSSPCKTFAMPSGLSTRSILSRFPTKSRVRSPCKYSLCDFDAGPPLKSGICVIIQFREILNGRFVWTYWFLSPLSLWVRTYRNQELPELSLISYSWWTNVKRFSRLAQPLQHVPSDTSIHSLQVIL